jgi:TRAP-type mannitol/chloroaromatic compound transport system permease small subunit
MGSIPISAVVVRSFYFSLSRYAERLQHAIHPVLVLAVLLFLPSCTIFVYYNTLTISIRIRIRTLVEYVQLPATITPVHILYHSTEKGLPSTKSKHG